LAFWVSGDGYFHKSGGQVRIATHGFTKLEVEQLAALLLEQFDLNSRIHIQRNQKGIEQYFIYIPKRELPKLQHLVKPFIPPMMAYRVGL